MQVKVTVRRHIEAAILREAESRHMTVEALCEQLIEVALVNLGSYATKTPIEDFATRKVDRHSEES